MIGLGIDPCAHKKETTAYPRRIRGRLCHKTDDNSKNQMFRTTIRLPSFSSSSSCPRRRLLRLQRRAPGTSSEEVPQRSSRQAMFSGIHDDLVGRATEQRPE